LANFLKLKYLCEIYKYKKKKRKVSLVEVCSGDGDGAGRGNANGDDLTGAAWARSGVTLEGRGKMVNNCKVEMKEDRAKLFKCYGFFSYDKNTIAKFSLINEGLATATLIHLMHSQL
jgi:hypothetical protein